MHLCLKDALWFAQAECLVLGPYSSSPVLFAVLKPFAKHLMVFLLNKEVVNLFPSFLQFIFDVNSFTKEYLWHAI